MTTDAERQAQVIELIRQGMTRKAIAAHLRMGQSTISRIVKTHGIEAQPLPAKVADPKPAKVADTAPTKPIPKLNSHGGHRQQGNAQGSQQGIGRGSAYIIARLERDGHEQLAQCVRSGLLSARSAARYAGIKK